MINIIKFIIKKAINNKFKEIKNDKQLDKCINILENKIKNSGYFQFNGAMKLAKLNGKKSIIIAKELKTYLSKYENIIFKNINITNPGFINFNIHKSFLNKQLKRMIVSKNLSIKNSKKKKKIIIDYSGPNIAKEMHVGHLRSTVIGECIARLLEFAGHEVKRINHLGDWGTQFGMLIYYIKKYHNTIDNMNLKNLSSYYKKSRKIFDENKNFRINSQNEVLNLQNKKKISMEIWRKINKISKKEYNKIYKILDVKIKSRGESFYKNLLKKIIEMLEKKKLIKTSDGAKCAYLNIEENNDKKIFPLIVQKTNGGYNYATTDLAAIYHRVKKEKFNRIIYVTDIGQENHFKFIFKLAREANFCNKYTKLNHISFGIMLKNNGKKIKTRSGKSEKLMELIKKAIKKAKIIIKEKNKHINIKKLNKNAKILGINAIKYNDLSGNMKHNYIFDYNKFLRFNGNTSSFLTYAYVRIQSIKKKIGKIKTYSLIKNKKINLLNDMEIDLAIQIINYEYIVNKCIDKLDPNILTTYLYKLASTFHKFFHEYKIINSNNEISRLLLSELIGKVLKKGLILLGLNVIEEM